MKVEENNIQTFCGKDLFKWESWDELDAGTLQFYGVEFCIDYLKKYNGMCVVLSIEGQLDIFSADESGNDVHEWSGFVTKIPGFLAGEKVYRVVHEYDDEFRFNVTETNMAIMNGVIIQIALYLVGEKLQKIKQIQRRIKL